MRAAATRRLPGPDARPPRLAVLQQTPPASATPTAAAWPDTRWELEIGSWELGVGSCYCQQRERQRRQGGRFMARIDHRDAGAMVDEQARSRASGGDGHAHAQAPIRSGAPQFGGNRARVAEQTGETREVEHDLTLPAHFEPWRKFTRDFQQHVRRRAFSGVKSAKHIPQHPSQPRATEPRRHGGNTF